MPKEKKDSDLSLSNYEKQRLENIARNKEKMFSLGLTSMKKVLEELEPPSKKNKTTPQEGKGKEKEKEKEEEDKDETVLVRRSSRVNPFAIRTTTLPRKKRPAKVKEESDSSDSTDGDGSEDTTPEVKKGKIEDEKSKKKRPTFNEKAFISKIEKEIKEILSKSAPKRALSEKSKSSTSKRTKTQSAQQTQTSPTSNSAPVNTLKRSTTCTTQTDLSFIPKKQKCRHSSTFATPSTTTASSNLHNRREERDRELKIFALNGDLLHTKTTVPLSLTTGFAIDYRLRVNEIPELHHAQNAITSSIPNFYLKLYGDNDAPCGLYSNNGQVYFADSSKGFRSSSSAWEQISSIYFTPPSTSKPIVCSWDPQTDLTHHFHRIDLGQDKIVDSHPTLSSSKIESKYLTFSDKTYGRKNLKSVVPLLPLLESFQPYTLFCS
eukprot:TRINITY_DN3842_c0_g4_i1.p1 TRINITY_DN3842_c0_g4~~TRINITY_DN3842_c0_g4_i1.p1  ORF type:complete len:434 (-),score=88.53 TRINITY_DN3842_c0_g4_i1:89-1390(-)